MFIDIDAKEPLTYLAKLSDKLENTTPLMKEVAGVLLDAVEENFAQEGRPDWVDLTEHTKESRRKKGKWPGKILQVNQGGLASSITARHSRDEAAAGTNKVYAPTHQFGAKKGEFGRTSSGLPIPFGDIPARDFLSLGQDDVREIDHIIRDYLDV